MAPFHKQCVARGCSAQPTFGNKLGSETKWACRAHVGMIGYPVTIVAPGVLDGRETEMRPKRPPRDLFAAAEP